MYLGLSPTYLWGPSVVAFPLSPSPNLWRASHTTHKAQLHSQVEVIFIGQDQKKTLRQITYTLETPGTYELSLNLT